VAEVITLPMIRIEGQADGLTTVQVQLSRRHFQRLQKRAKEWNVSLSDAAAFVIEQALAPHK
jgi:hypothetical protein